jgi:hypothetical protein
MITEAFPLQWPNGWRREPQPVRSRFGSYNSKPTIAASTNQIVREMDLFGGVDIIISTNLKLKLDGLPYSRQPEPNDQGVAVYFTYAGEQKVIACDSFDKIGCNLWAIAKTIEAMRGIERWGCSEIITKAFTGFVALPEKNHREWWEVMGFKDLPAAEEAKAKYRELVKQYHPDQPGGSADRFREIQQANEKAKIHFTPHRS